MRRDAAHWRAVVIDENGLVIILAKNQSLNRSKSCFFSISQRSSEGREDSEKE